MNALLEMLKGLYLNVKAMDETGQTLVEYALILVLISIVVIVALTGLGTEVANTFNTVNSTLANHQ